MKRTNKFLSVLLSLIMIISIIPMSTITANADSAESRPDYDNQELMFGDYEYAIISETRTTAPSSVEGCIFRAKALSR